MDIRRWVSSVFGIGLVTGCAAVSSPETTGAEAVGAAPLASSGGSAIVSDACPGTVWIGKSDNAEACTTKGNWKATRLFPNAPVGLAGYCYVEWTGTSAPGTTDFAALPADGTTKGITWLDNDCRVVAGLTAPDTATEQARATVVGPMVETFMSAIEAPTAITYPADRPYVHVAVVDSQPAPGVEGNYPHGFGVQALINAIACPSGSCRVHTAPYLALNLMPSGVADNAQGGFFGRQSRLAATIYAAAHDWVSQGRPGHLMINLSVGWDGIYNGDEDGEISMAVTAVKDAIAYARCAGALVIVAAGNASGGPPPPAPPGPMYPAAWETTLIDCPGQSPNIADNKPLVRAVGGVDALNQRPPWTRDGATPRLVADGHLVPTNYAPADPGGTKGPYSGTSMATAAVSGAAAAIWALQPTLTADQVADRLYATGASLGVDVDPYFCATPPCNDVRRLSVCAALQGAPAAVQCTRALPTSNPVWTQAQLTDIQTVDVEPSFVGTAELPVTGLDCEGTLMSVSSTPALLEAEDVCPVEHLPNETVLPWLGGQPSVPICGACGLFAMSYPAEAVLEIAVNEELMKFDVKEVYPLSLTIYADDQTVLERHDLGSLTPGGLAPGEVYKFELPGIDTSQARYAVIEWQRTENGQSTSDVAFVQ